MKEKSMKERILDRLEDKSDLEWAMEQIDLWVKNPSKFNPENITKVNYILESMKSS